MEYYLSMLRKKTSHIVLVSPLKSIHDESISLFEDARSAAFYAFGIALKEKETVFLLVPGEFLASTFTAMTEAWFQKANVIVVAFFDRVSDVKTVWMDRCVLNTMTAGEGERELIENYIENNSGINGPALLNIVCDKSPVEKTDYSNAMKYLNGRAVITFNGAESGRGSTDVEYRYKYGLLSKYIGMSGAMDCGVLLCTADAIMVDVSIFRTRYANSNMKIIIIDDGSVVAGGIDNWITSNGWCCKVSEHYEDIAWLLAQEKQAVLIVEEV